MLRWGICRLGAISHGPSGSERSPGRVLFEQYFYIISAFLGAHCNRHWHFNSLQHIHYAFDPKYGEAFTLSAMCWKGVLPPPATLLTTSAQLLVHLNSTAVDYI